MLRRRCRKEKCEMMQDEKEVKGQVRGRGKVEKPEM